MSRAAGIRANHETPEEYGYRLGFEAGYVEALAAPPEEYRGGADPYSRGYMAGCASDGRGVSEALDGARRASIAAQQAAWDSERKAYRAAWRVGGAK